MCRDKSFSWTGDMRGCNCDKGRSTQSEGERIEPNGNDLTFSVNGVISDYGSVVRNLDRP